MKLAQVNGESTMDKSLEFSIASKNSDQIKGAISQCTVCTQQLCTGGNVWPTRRGCLGPRDPLDVVVRAGQL